MRLLMRLQPKSSNHGELLQLSIAEGYHCSSIKKWNSFT